MLERSRPDFPVIPSSRAPGGGRGFGRSLVGGARRAELPPTTVGRAELSLRLCPPPAMPRRR